MCGICGLVGMKASPDVMNKMLESIKHRGPDDEGVFQEEKVFLGHRRLSILDLSSAGHQPMSLDDLVLVFNGEIYNYIELRNELIAIGHEFESGTDTEVILHAYSEWGKECFSKLRGMWALAIYDKSKEELILSRDRFGIKPLYYAYKDNVLFFASEIPAILAAGVLSKANMDRVVAYLMVDISDTDHDTFFEGINQLPGGENLYYDLQSGSCDRERFYDFSKAVEQADTNDFEESFYQAVRLHLRSDVKVGTCLSGGLDSSTLAAVAQYEFSRQGGDKMTAVTAKSEEAANDESHYAKIVVEKCGLNWQLAYPCFDDFVKYHREMMRMQGEPVGGASVFMQFWVMKKAKEAGIKVMLDGQGGDEAFLGYERYYIGYLLFLLKQGDVFRFVKDYKLIVESSKLTARNLLQYFVYFSCWNVRKWYLSRRMKYVKKKLRERFFRLYRERAEQSGDTKKIQTDEILRGHLSTLLHYEDRSSMYFSIETRVPYVDHVLLEKAVKLGVREKIQGGWTKYCLREISAKFLPGEIAWRKNKFGFEAPENSWLNKYVKEMQMLVNESELLKKVLYRVPDLKDVPVRERWRFYNIAVWEKDYLL